VSILSILLGWTLPRYEQLFADMKLSPPAMTALVLWIGRQFRSYGWVLIWLIPLSPASLMFWKASKITSQDELQRFGKRLSMAVYVLVVGGFVLAVMALLVPMVQTFDTLTK
jgi:type II secretory pathway component PulF